MDVANRLSMRRHWPRWWYGTALCCTVTRCVGLQHHTRIKRMLRVFHSLYGQWLQVYLLNDQRHGRALVQQAQLAGGVLAVAGVPVDATVQQRSVEVAHQGPNVPARQFVSCRV